MRFYPFSIASVSLITLLASSLSAQTYSVRAYGAAGDGEALDSEAINAAIAAASQAGGGTVDFPAGDYLSYSIRLRSHVTLHLHAGATIIAADPPAPGVSVGTTLRSRTNGINSRTSGIRIGATV